MFDELPEKEGLITHTGTIIDATFVDAPKQRNHHDENKTIKEGKVPEEWEKPENAHKLAQKDTDARWTKKNNEVHFGYKDHVKCDADSKLITNYGVTDAALHDSQRCTELLEKQTKRCMLTVLIQVPKLRIICRKIAKITFAKKGIKIIL